MNKKAIFITTSALIFLYGVYYWGTPAVLNHQKFKSFITSKLEEQTGLNPSINNISFKMGFLPALWMKADEISLKNSDKSNALIIKEPALKIALFPILIKHFEIKHLSAVYSEAHFSVDKNNNLKLGEYTIVFNPKSKFQLTKASAFLKNYKIYLTDKMLQKEILLDGQYLNLEKYEKNKFLKVAAKSRWTVGNKTSEINFDTNIELPLNMINCDKVWLNADVKNMDLSAFSAYLKTISNGKYEKTQGILNFTARTEKKDGGHNKIISNISLDNFGLMNKDLAQASYMKDRLTIDSTIETINNGIHIDDLVLTAPKINFKASGDVTKINSKIPDLNIKAELKNSRSENIITILPGYENLLPEFNFYKLKQHILYSDVNGSLLIKGQANRPEMFGDVSIEDAYLVKRIPDIEKGANVQLSLNKRIMTLNAQVKTDPKEEVNVKGKFKLFVNRNSDIYITTTENINLKKAQDVVLPLHEILKFEVGPVEMMTLNGFAKMNMHAGGSKTDPHAWGDIDFHKASATLTDIKHITLTNAAGNVNFNNKDVTFKTTQGFIHNQPAKITGTCSLDGGMDVVAETKGQNIVDFIRTIRDSELLTELQEVIKPVDTAGGKADLYLNLTGTLKSGDEIVFNENLFAKGYLDLHSAFLTVKDFPALFKNLAGRINFVNEDADFDIKTTIGNSLVKSTGTVKNDIINAKAVSDKFNVGDALDIAVKLDKRLPNIKELKYVNTSFTGYYTGKADGIIHPEGITLNGKIIGNFGAQQPLTVNNGTFLLKNRHLTVSPLKGTFMSNPFSAEKVEVTNMLSGKEIVSGNFLLNNFDLDTLNKSASFSDIYPQYKNILKDFGRFDGKINIASKIKNNRIRFFTKLNDTSFVYKPKNLKISLMNGHILLDDQTLYLSNINSYAGRMPVYINGKILHIQNKPAADLYINAKPTQEFFDQFINNKSVYPVKLKGDVNCTSKLTGLLTNINSKTELKLDENSSIYYMGATIGEAANPVKIYLDNTYNPKYLKINKFQYDKIITSQNNKDFANTQLTANGTIEFLDKNNVKFNNFKVKTSNPTDAKIFNIIFKKPLMKQGLFTSDLTINGTSLNPKILGQLNVTSIDVPFFDAVINDFHFDFKKDIVNITSQANILTNRIKLQAQMLNNLTFPITFNNIRFHFDSLDLNEITQSLQDYDADIYKQQIVTTGSTVKEFDPSGIIIKNAQVTADKILVKSLEATDFTSDMTLNNSKLLNISNYKFMLAEGDVYGNLQYNLVDKDLKLYSKINNANANIISESLFDLKGQLYGIVNGELEFKCNGKNQPSCMNSLSGNGTFIVANGKMPKLGSLEYLLKAGNLVKSGITGLSINGLIDLITPLKTGEFQSISGSYIINDGIAQNINIYSKGKDLNLYLSGSYNVVTSIADMKVYGTLSNNITTVFGKLKNASLNTLLNTIPLLNRNELSPELEAKIKKIPNYDTNNNISRIFAVDIEGDINGINYVKSFKWVK